MIKHQFLFALAVTFMASLSHADDILNIRTNPFMVFGNSFVNLELDFKVGENWAVGPTIQVSAAEPLFEVGVRVTYFEQQTFQQGWMTGIELSYSQTTLEDTYYDSSQELFCVSTEAGTDCSNRADELIKLSLNEGYLWRWETFNIGAGLGAQVSIPIDEPSDPIFQSNIYFSIGWVR